MAQAQLNFTEESRGYFRECGFISVTWSSMCKTITCELDEGFSMVIRKKRQNIKVTLRKGTQSMSLPYSMIENLCDLKESIQLLSSFLEGKSTEQAE